MPAAWIYILSQLLIQEIFPKTHLNNFMAEINISEVIKKVVDASKKELDLIITESEPYAMQAASQYLVNLESRGTALLNVVADQNFEGDKLAFVIARIKDEPEILKTEVFSFIIIGAGIAQNIINSIQNILLDAIQSILPSA